MLLLLFGFIFMIFIIIGFTWMLWAFCFMIIAMVKATEYTTSTIKKNKAERGENDVEKMIKDQFESEFGHREPKGFKEGMRYGNIQNKIKKDIRVKKQKANREAWKKKYDEKQAKKAEKKNK